MQAEVRSFMSFTCAILLLLALTAFKATAQEGPAESKPHGLPANQFEAPISFEPNEGQAQEPVKFMARGPGYTLSLTRQGLVFSFERPESQGGLEAFHSLAVKFVGANSSPKLAPGGELTTKSSYFMGADPAKWRTGIPNYAHVTIKDVYPGIDVGYRGTHGRLQCSFLVSPDAKPNQIVIAISGANNPRLDPAGDLILQSGNTKLRLSKPTAYQYIGANKRTVSAQYLLRRGRIIYALSDYDRTKGLTIDQVLSYERYLTTEGAVGSPPRFEGRH